MKHLLAIVLFTPLFALADTTVIYNANGYTPTYKGKLKQFSTLVIKDGKVVKTGNDELKNSFPRAPAFDAQQKTLLPGLIDAHGHVIGLGKNLSQLDLRGSDSIKNIQAKLANFAKNKQGWIIGRGWNQELWPNKQFPTAADLDLIVKDKPVILSRVDGHAIWVNSKAMELAGIKASTLTPEGGEIIKTASGSPSGIFIDKAESLINAVIPKSSMQSTNQALDMAGEHLLSLGITSTHDAGIDKQTWQIYKQRAEQGTLPLRIVAMLSAASSELETMHSAFP